MQINTKATFAMALDAIASHKLRSGLTVLGIVIGITTVVTVASLLTGLNNSIVEFFQEFGPDSIFVSRLSGDPSGANAPPKERKRRPVRPEYAAYVKNTVHSISDVALSVYVIPPAGRVMTAKVPGYQSDNLNVTGASANLYDISPRSVRQGRIFTDLEARRAARVVVLGSSFGGRAVSKTGCGRAAGDDRRSGIPGGRCVCEGQGRLLRGERSGPAGYYAARDGAAALSRVRQLFSDGEGETRTTRGCGGGNAGCAEKAAQGSGREG